MVQTPEYRLYLRVVGGGKRGQRDLVIAGALQAAGHGGDDIIGAALPHRTVYHAGLAEAAAAAAAAQYLHRQAVMGDFGKGHYRVCQYRCGVEVLYQALADARGGFCHCRRQAAICLRLIERGDIDPLDLSQCQKRLATVAARGYAATMGSDDLGYDFLTLANDYRVEEGRQRLRVESPRPAAQHYRVAGTATGAMQGDAGQIQGFKDVGGRQLVRQGDAEEVEAGNRRTALQAEQRYLLPAHRGYHVYPGQVDPFGQTARQLVDYLIEDADGLVGLPQLVAVRVEQDSAVGRILLLWDVCCHGRHNPVRIRCRGRPQGVVFVVDIARRPFDLAQQGLDFRPEGALRHLACAFWPAPGSLSVSPESSSPKSPPRSKYSCAALPMAKVPP